MKRPFIDRYAKVGRAKAVIKSEEAKIKATAASRSLASLIPNERKNIQLKIQENGYLIIDFSSVIGDKAKISKVNVIKLIQFLSAHYTETNK